MEGYLKAALAVNEHTSTRSDGYEEPLTTVPQGTLVNMYVSPDLEHLWCDWGVLTGKLDIYPYGNHHGLVTGVVVPYAMQYLFNNFLDPLERK